MNGKDHEFRGHYTVLNISKFPFLGIFDTQILTFLWKIQCYIITKNQKRIISFYSWVHIHWIAGWILEDENFAQKNLQKIWFSTSKSRNCGEFTKSLFENFQEITRIMNCDITECEDPFMHTLDSGINIGLCLLIFGFFSRGYILIKENNP